MTAETHTLVWGGLECLGVVGLLALLVRGWWHRPVRATQLEPMSLEWQQQHTRSRP